MSFMKLNICIGTKSVDLEVEKAEGSHIATVIKGAFGIFGVSLQQREVTQGTIQGTLSEPNSQTLGDLKEKQSRELNIAKQSLEMQELQIGVIPPVPLMDWKPDPNAKITAVQGSPREVTLIGSDRSLTTSVGEKLIEAAGKSKNRPDWYDTGIKFKDGVPHYRTRYWCQNSGCNLQGNQYILLTAETTECHGCGTVHKVRPALGDKRTDGVPNKDRFGNFFRADQLA